MKMSKFLFLILTLFFLAGCDPFQKPPIVNPPTQTTPGSIPTPTPVPQTKPVAQAGADESSYLGYLVSPDGSDSSDPNGDSLDFLWEFVTVPAGSGMGNEDLTGADTALVSFLPDIRGLYTLRLTVSDGTELDTDEVDVLIENQPPIADAGDEQVTDINTPVQLDGSSSYNPNADEGDTLTYDWQVISQPAGANPVITGAGSAAPWVTPDLEGEYVLELTVDDGYDTDTDLVSVISLSPGSGGIGITLE